MAMQRQSGHSGRLSVVIPAVDVAALEATLVSVLEHRPDDCDVVVALGAAYDDPWNIGEEVVFVEAARDKSLVGCVNAGVAAATGDVIHVLAAGWLATEGWTDAVMPHFASRGVGAVVPLGVSEGDREQPVSAGIRRTPGGRSVPVVPRRLDDRIAVRRPPVAPALEAGFWRADLLRDVGFSAACGDALAAADMAAVLASAATEVVFEPASRIVAGPTPRGESAFMAGLHAERLFWRSLSSVPLVPAAVGHAAEVLRHAAATAPLGTAGMLAGRLLGLFGIGSAIGRMRELAALRRAAAEGDDTARTVRVDRAHGTASRPHLAPPVRELRRSA